MTWNKLNDLLDIIMEKLEEKREFMKKTPINNSCELDEDDYKIIALEAELEMLVDEILAATDLEKLKEIILKNFPEKNKLEQSNS